MKKTILLSLTALTLLACSNKENDKAGFIVNYPSGNRGAIYANTVTDTLTFISYGPWSISANDNWCQPNVTSGKGSSLNNLTLQFQQNRTGEQRSVRLTMVDRDEPNKGYSTVIFTQAATRGDGSLGNASLIKKITGDDNSVIEATYDTLARPTRLVVQKDGSRRELTFNYGVNTMVMTDDGKQYESKMNRLSYQPERIVGQNDTTYTWSSWYFNGSLAFYRVLNHHRNAAAETLTYVGFAGGKLWYADDTHDADTVGATVDGVFDKFVVSYTNDIDARLYSLDVNQLLFGVENMHPTLLLSMFKTARNSHLIKTAKSATDERTVDYVLDNTRLKTLKVTDVKTNKTVTYSIEYVE